jgi:methionyl-tRNA formyltransferase
MSKVLRIVFMGTPAFAVASLDILNNSAHQVVAVVTAPDKPAGRGKQLNQSAVKEYALNNHLPLLQPTNLKDTEFVTQLQNLKADLFVVVAFRMLPAAVWKLPALGTINLHASLLPQYRGAAPINWAIVNGETETGATTFFINEHIDTGDLIDRVSVSIDEHMDAGNLHDLLMEQGAALLFRTVNAIAEGKVKPIAQGTLSDKTDLKEAPKITRDNSRIDWNQPSQQIINLIRGMSPYPGAYTLANNPEKTLVKIFKVCKAEEKLKSGEIFSDGKSKLLIGTADGSIRVEEIQIPGKRKMAVKDLLNGYNPLILNSFS